RLPVVLNVDPPAILPHVRQRQSFGRIRRRRRTQEARGKPVIGYIAAEIERAARNVRRAAEKLHAPVVYARFESVRSGADRDAIAKLIQAILIEAVAAIRLREAIGAGDVHARNA